MHKISSAEQWLRNGMESACVLIDGGIVELNYFSFRVHLNLLKAALRRCVCPDWKMSEKSNRCLVEFHSVRQWLISFWHNVKPQNKPQDSVDQTAWFTLRPLVTSKSFQAVIVEQMVLIRNVLLYRMWL